MGIGEVLRKYGMTKGNKTDDGNESEDARTSALSRRDSLHDETVGFKRK